MHLQETVFKVMDS